MATDTKRLAPVKIVARAAIIGAGPTGLSALESLVVKASQSEPPLLVHVTLFESNPHLGSGPNFAPDQTAANVLNIPERVLALDARPCIQLCGCDISGFPGYRTWASVDEDAAIDTFPPRAKLGDYLLARLTRLTDALSELGLLTLVPAAADSLSWDDDHWIINTRTNTYGPFDEVAIAVGHTPTTADESIKKWHRHSDRLFGRTLVEHAYPTHEQLTEKVIPSGSSVAIRGLGLAMIDVVKALTEDRGGQFIGGESPTKPLHYEQSGREPSKIFPFSLDGLPPAPKPLGQHIDARYTPTSKQFTELAEFFDELMTSTDDSAVCDRLIEQLSELHAMRFLELNKRARKHALDDKALTALGVEWLNGATIGNSLIVDTHSSTAQMLNAFTLMALDQQPASFDYSFGQLWRHIEPLMYSHFSYAPWSSEVIAQVTRLDEKMKRYAFGPPVQSAQRLLALTESRLLTFQVVNDPDIECVPAGWKLNVNDNTIVAHAMVDSVLDSPNATRVTAPLVRQLLHEGLMEPIHDELGVQTAKDGTVMCNHSHAQRPLAVLGRLAKGTLLGTDAILEVFGPRQDTWADGVVARIGNQ